MIIREPTPEDWNELRNIHAKFYANEFRFEDFWRAAISVFAVINDDNNRIVTAGAVRPIAEMVAITNKDTSVRARQKGLNQMLLIANHLLRDTPMNQLHVFIQDKKWEDQLLRHGFSRTMGNALYINLTR